MSTPTTQNPPAKEEWVALLRAIIPRLPAYLKLGAKLAGSSEVPNRRKLGLLLGVGYAVLPFDLIPGVIPVLGQLDDLLALLHGIRSALRQCPPALADRLLAETGLTTEQLDRDIDDLGTVAVGLSRTVVKAVWRGGRAAGRGVASGARAVWNAAAAAYRAKKPASPG